MTTFDQALAAHRAGRLSEAEPVYRRLLAAEPDNAEVLHLLAVLLLQKGDAAGALPLAERAVAAAPSLAKAWNTLPKAWNTLANIRAALGRTAEAADALQRAVTLDDGLVEARLNLGILLSRLGRLAEAEAALRIVVERQPANAAARNNLGSVLHHLGRGDEAEAEFREAVRLAPAMPQALLNLGIRAKAAGEVEEAEQCLAKVPGDGPRILRETLLPAITMSAADIDRVRARYEQGLDRLLADPPKLADPLAEIGQLPQFYLAYHDRDDRALQEKLAAMLRRACPSLDFVAPHCAGWQPGRRIRVGVISRHLHGHTIGKLQMGFIANLPREHFEVVLFTPAGRDDDMARRIRASADAVVLLPGELAPARAAVAQARLDVAYFPDIGMDPFSYYLAFARFAPVQVTTWGHPVTPGTGSIDWFLSSVAMDPVGNEAHYTERLHRFTHPGVYYYPPPPPTAGRTREDFGIPAGRRLYMCPQSPFKLHPDFDRLIAGVLRADPGGVVGLIDARPSWRQALDARFRAAMPDVADRIAWVPRMSQADYIACCAAADVMLDVPQFSGGNTTYEALSVATPIVTLPSAFLKGRITMALLAQAGLDWAIAADESAYVEKAVAIAAEPARWRAEVAKAAPTLYEDRTRVDEFAQFLLMAVEDAVNRQ
ncbi:MAG: tetratricopeptide repeat protein [Actinomycetota bacterium]